MKREQAPRKMLMGLARGMDIRRETLFLHVEPWLSLRLKNRTSGWREKFNLLHLRLRNLTEKRGEKNVLTISEGGRDII